MKNLLIASMFVIASSSAMAQVSVSDPWVRATVSQQKATGAFMNLSSKSDTRLVSVSSPVAHAEIHEMAMENNVMRMREIPGLDVPAGKVVELKPGGYHVMFFDLKQPIKEGDIVPLKLTFENKDKKIETIDLKVPARALTSTHSAPAPSEMHMHGH